MTAEKYQIRAIVPRYVWDIVKDHDDVSKIDGLVANLIINHYRAKDRDV